MHVSSRAQKSLNVGAAVSHGLADFIKWQVISSRAPPDSQRPTATFNIFAVEKGASSSSSLMICLGYQSLALINHD